MLHTYLAVDEDGEENIFDGDLPIRGLKEEMNWWILDGSSYNKYVSLPKGSILKLIGKELTWADEPYLYE